MAEIRRLLAHGVLGTSKAPLYTVPSGKQGRVGLVICANTSNTVGYKVDLYVTPNGLPSRLIIGKGTALPAAGSAEFPEDGVHIQLAAGDALEGLADTADVVEFTVWGTELTPAS
jgi:hypothetical protein